MADEQSEAMIGSGNADISSGSGSSSRSRRSKLSSKAKRKAARLHAKKQLKSFLKYKNPKYLSMLNHLRFYLPQVGGYHTA